MGTNRPTNGAGRAGSTTEKAGSDTTGIGAGSAGSTGHGTGGAGTEPSLVAGVEHVGVVDGNSPERLIAEVQAAAASAPIADPITGQPQIDQAATDPAGEWSALTPHIVTVACGVVLPRWEIPPTEQTEVAESMGQCLEQLFPGGIEGRYACWVRLVMACGAITISTAHRHGGKLPPLFSASAKPAQPTPPPIDPMHVTSLTQ